VPHNSQHHPANELRSTLAQPDLVAASASRDRLDLAQQAGALELALDTADTIGAQNSIEQMLAHQLAAAHCAAMKLTKHMNRQIERMSAIADGTRQSANVEATRLAGAISRLMLTFQHGAETLQRVRSRGRQVITVQHDTVGPGGQAIVAGEMTTGGRRADQT